MPGQTEELGLDASQLIAELAKVQAAFRAHASTVGDIATSYVRLNQKGDDLDRSFTATTTAGQRLRGTIKELNGELELQVSSITQVTNALKEQQKAQLELAATNAQSILKLQGIGTATPQNLQGTLATAQGQLVKALAAFGAGGEDAATQMIERLKQGFVDVEIGVRGKLQAALINLLQIQTRITDQQQKQASLATPAAGIDTAQLAAFRANILQAFPVPTNASISAVFNYQQALNRLIELAARGKIPFQDLQRLFNDVARNPLKDFSGGDIDIGRAQGSIQRVIASFNAMTNSAKQAEDQGRQTGRSLFISFDQFLRILEVQIVHRIFGNFITGMQNAIGVAADLQIRISEIRTISQGTGLTFEALQAQIRAASEQFAKPQADVAEAIYQGFSNQVIKTASDMTVLNETLRLSRIGVTSAASAMELMSSVLNSYRLAAFEAGNITDQLFKAIEIGRFRAQDVANSLGRVTVVAADLGVRLEEVLGLLANLTRRGVTPAEALTQISAIMQGLIKPSTEMEKVLRQWGVDSGTAAIQTFGFVEVLRRLSQEAQNGNRAIADLFPNVRALRGITGATGGGGITDLLTDIDQIRRAGPSAAEASGIVAESAGARFRQELIKIQNFFTNDFANGFLSTIERIAAPFGGIANIVKTFGTAVIELIGTISSFVKAGLDIITLGGNLNLNVGSLIKLFVAYKAAVVAITIAQQVAATVTAFWATIKLQAAAAQTIETAATLANTTAKEVNTVTIAGQTAVILGSSTASNIAAAATTALTFRQIAATIAARALTVAMAATPFIILAAAIGLLTGAFDPLFDRFNTLRQQTEAIQGLESQLTRSIQREREERNRIETQQLNSFREDLRSRSQAINTVLADIRRRSETLVESQRDIVSKTSEELRLSLRGVEDEMSRLISEIKKKISEAETNIRESTRRQFSFADREASNFFQNALRFAGRVPEVISGLSPLGFQQQQIEDLQQGGRAQAFDQQRLLIQQRLAALQREASVLQAQGDRESMESARRKYEEIRRLTEQLFGIETEHSRQLTLQSATEQARITGSVVQASFQVDLRRFQALMDAITAREREAEETFRRNEEERRTVEEIRLRDAQARARAVADAARRIASFQVTDAQSQLLERFRGPGGLSTFQREWERMVASLNETLEHSEVNPALQLQAAIALGQQRTALEAQIQRTITNNHIAEVQARTQAEVQAIEQLRTTAAAARNEAQETVRNAIPEATRLLAQLGEQINQNIPSPTSPAATRLRVALRPLVDRFVQEQAEATRALLAFNAARGTENEQAAFEQLRISTDVASNTFREFMRLRFPGLLGSGLAQDNTAIQDLLNNVSQARIQARNSQQQLEEAQRRSNVLSEQLAALPPNLQAAAIGINNIGNIAANQALNINNLAEAIRQLNAQVEQMRGGGPAAPIAPGDFGVGGAFASGGLIGGRFSGNGPDNRLIWARDGEYILNAESSRRFYSQVTAMNAGRIPHFAQGGLISTTNVGDITINVDGSKGPQATGRAVLNILKRELRRGNGGS